MDRLFGSGDRGTPDEQTPLTTNRSEAQSSNVPDDRPPDWLPSRAGREEGALSLNVRKRLNSAVSLAKRQAEVKQGNKQGAGEALAYNPRLLLTWRVIAQIKGTVLNETGIYWNFAVLSLVALLTFGMTFLCVADPHTLRVDKFNTLVGYFKVFIAFMVGLFLTSCLNRWWECVVALTDFFLVIKKITWLMNTMGVKQENREPVQRLCLMSCLLLESELTGVTDPNTAEFAKEKWENLHAELTEEGLITADEVEHLTDSVDASDRCVAVWSWIGVHFTLAKLPPPIQTMLYSMGSDGLACVKRVKLRVQVQMPLLYTHMLAFLVHLNNGMLAVITGVSIAVLCSETAHSFHGGRTWGTVLRSVQGIVCAVLSLFVQPMIYHAFLEIGAILADPFTHQAHGLNMLDYVNDLRVQLRELNDMSTTDEAWLDTNAPSGNFAIAHLAKMVRSAPSSPRKDFEKNPERAVTPRKLEA